MTFIKKHKNYLLTLLLTVIASAISHSFLTKNAALFPFNDSIVFYAYNDHVDKGNSKATSKIDSANYIELTYCLKEGYAYPYTGLSIENKNPENFFKLNEYDFLNIKLSALKGTNIPISLMVFDSKFSKQNDDSSLLTFQTIVHISSKEQSFKLNFQDFKIPQWWYNENNITEVIQFDKNLHRVKTINIENCNLLALNTDDEIKIAEISLQKTSNIPIYIIGVGLLLFIIFFIKNELKNRKTRKIVLEYSATKTTPDNDSTESVINFIAVNYQNPELSISFIKYKLVLPENKITEEIKVKTGLSFKQYLNDIRLHEAKSLLNSTKLSISEIAYQVGYSNVSHFNRVFKSVEKISPSDFRKNTNK